MKQFLLLMILGFLVVYIPKLNENDLYKSSFSNRLWIAVDSNIKSAIIDCTPCIPTPECCEQDIIEWANKNNPTIILGVWNLDTGEERNLIKTWETTYRWEFK